MGKPPAEVKYFRAQEGPPSSESSVLPAEVVEEEVLPSVLEEHGELFERVIRASLLEGLPGEIERIQRESGLSYLEFAQLLDTPEFRRLLDSARYAYVWLPQSRAQEESRLLDSLLSGGEDRSSVFSQYAASPALDEIVDDSKVKATLSLEAGAAFFERFRRGAMGTGDDGS